MGRAFVFGDDVNTDVIAPSDYFGEPVEVVAAHAFEPVRPGFVEEFEPGDVVVAGENFGSGSNRLTAPTALREVGAAAVVAESFARIFYRNAVAIGLPPVTAPGVTDAVSEGDAVEVDLAEGVVHNLDTGASVEAEPLPRAVRRIFDAGGLIAYYRAHPEGLSLD